ncbi:MAG: hypothetical protein ACO29Z_04310 [Crocinitomicaceae bacterium]
MKISVAFDLTSVRFISMTYAIRNSSDDSTEYTELNAEDAYSQALAHVGFYLKRTDGQDLSQDSDDIKEFMVIDWSDSTLVFKFMEGWYENACLKALTELGYSVEEEQPTNVLHVTF